MKRLYAGRAPKRIATLFLVLILTDLAYPLASYALTSGPSQPEFSSFEPVSTNQLVDEFSGDFTYNIPVINIPGPNGSDYPLSLSYHSGATPEEEASWVGYGWTLNPGAINRNTRGFPDDFSKTQVDYFNKMPMNWTVTAGGGVGLELYSQDKTKKLQQVLGVSFNTNLAIRYNNYQGYGYNAGAGLSLGKGVVSLGYNVVDGAGSFSAAINPAAILNQFKEQLQEAEKKNNAQSKDKQPDEKKPARFAGNKVSLLGGNHGLFTYAEANRATRAANFTGASVNVGSGMQINPTSAPVGVTMNVSGSYAWQKNVEQEGLDAYGYLYSAYAKDNPNAIRDYFTEKETTYNKRDSFLGIPFNNADIFSVSGEGVGGGFRLYHEQVGEFVPNTKVSKTTITNVSPEISGGLNFGVGADYGVGWQHLSEGPWQEKEQAKEGVVQDKERLTFSNPNEGDDKVFFRFANDLGGESAPLRDLSDEPIAVRPGSGGALDKHELSQLGKTAAHGRASYIAYHTVADVYRASTGGQRLSRLFSQRSDLPAHYAGMAPEAICEMSVVNAAGSRYIYGLPVLSQKEGNLQYSVQGEPLQHNYAVSTSKRDKDLAIKVGETRAAAYASSFPLTEIRTPDYIDRTLNGPSPDDFGGYTRFNYIKAYGGTNSPADWYNWRIPYNGLLFQVNSLSDRDDDMGTVSYGQKEIVYLQSVQTKTHTAIFVTTSRQDGRDAGLEGEGGGTPRARTGTENPTDKKELQKLVRIDLYVNSDVVQNGKGEVSPKDGVVPIKSVHFSYTNELCSGLPNALLDPNIGKHQGKLTLTRVWFEYQGIPTKISPYTFSYTYPSNYAAYPALYQPGKPRSVTAASSYGLPLNNKNSTGPHVYDYANLSPTVQNPFYNPFSLDAWGNYRSDGETRAGNLQPWLDQRDLDPATNATAYNWDPAAWQLKGITLPTGGQIQVQYEADDYAFVQNKPVHAMVSLADVTGNAGLDGNKYFLDLTSVGIAPGSDDMQATVNALRAQYLAGDGRKIFFKFLYNLADAKPPMLNPLTPNTDYITGYASVKDVGLTDGRVWIELDNAENKYTLPHQVCKNFLQTQRAGKLGGNDFQASKNAPVKAVRDLLAWYKTVTTNANCVAINWPLSYFRVPLVKPKKGGGLRVKRLLTFDKTGLDGQPVLYGSEYLYRMPYEGRMISSGVATTEPSAMREENILVDFLPRLGQRLASKIISGIDCKQTEGPLGESLLPAPSVGYAQVVVRNIHSGRTTTGYSVSEYATVRDYPMQVKWTTLQAQNDFRLQYALLATNQVNNVYATQGYSFILNNMHGQVLRKAAYAGDYPGLEPTPAGVNKRATPTNEQRYTYYEPAQIDQQRLITPGDFIPVATEQGEKIVETPVASRIYPGREVDITAAQKAVKDNMLDVSIETDATIGFAFIPIPFFGIFPSVTRSEAQLYTHVTSKVIRYPAVVKRIESMQDGIRHVTENIAFDRFSGQVVQTRSTDEFKGGYVQENVQAAWVRPELGRKADRENRMIKSAEAGGISIAAGTGDAVWLTFSATCTGLDKISRGDHLVITTANNSGDNTLYFADAPDFASRRVRVYPVTLPLTSAAPALPQEAIKTIQIVTSGRSNQLTASAGSTTYHGIDYAELEAVAPFTTAAKYGPSAFTAMINTWLQGSAQTTDKLPANSTSYSHMNMTAYTNKLPACVQDPADVTIKDVVLAKQIVNGKLKVSMVSFRVACDPNGTPIQN